MRPGSTLLQETGRVPRHRVSEETRSRVQTISAKKASAFAAHSAKHRKELEDKENKRLRDYEKRRLGQLNTWREGPVNSPLRLDLNEIDKALAVDWRSHFHSKTKRAKHKAILANMTGKPKFDMCTDAHLSKIADPSAKLAMHYRQLRNEASTLKAEERGISELMDTICLETESMFPKVAMAVAFKDSGSDFSSVFGGASLIGKQKVSAEDAQRIKAADNRVYSAAGRYDEFGRFIMADELQTKAGMASSKFAQAAGTAGPSNLLKKEESLKGMDTSELKRAMK